MKITCKRKPLLEACQQVYGVVNPRTPKEILKDVLMIVTPEGMTLVGSDTEIGLRRSVEVEAMDVSGQAILPMLRLISILKEASDDMITLVVNDKAIEVKCGFSKFKLSSKDASEFPPVEGFEDTEFYVVPAAILRTMIRRVVFATDDTSSSRYQNGSVNIEATADKFTLIATDGRRLAVAQTDATTIGSPVILEKCLVPEKAMVLIERSLGDATGVVHLALRPNSVSVKYESTTITAQLTQGMFPNYKRAIPASFSKQFSIVVGPFASAIRQSMIVTNQETLGVDFQFTKGNLKLASSVTDVGESEIETPIPYDDEDLTITLMPSYIIDMLKTFEVGDVLMMQLIDAKHMAMFSKDSYRYGIMPISREK